MSKSPLIPPGFHSTLPSQDIGLGNNTNNFSRLNFSNPLAPNLKPNPQVQSSDVKVDVNEIIGNLLNCGNRKKFDAEMDKVNRRLLGENDGININEDKMKKMNNMTGGNPYGQSNTSNNFSVTNQYGNSVNKFNTNTNPNTNINFNQSQVGDFNQFGSTNNKALNIGSNNFNSTTMNNLK